MKKKILVVFMIMIICFTFAFVIMFSNYLKSNESNNQNQNNENNLIYNMIENTVAQNITDPVILNENEQNVILKQEIDDWRLVLVNHENELPENFEVSLSNIDTTRQFDSRAISYLKDMLVQIKKDGIRNAWVQSAYRSINQQEQLYEEKIREYMNMGMSRENAEKETSKFINKPEASEHNLGLAVDFNYVDINFEKTKAFTWLTQNAENYGFILRYKKEKENITKVSYEPWHWRFVGVEHAKAMNNLDMCLEEYVEYLKIETANND